MFVNCSQKWTTLTISIHFKNSQSHSRVEAYIASPTPSSYVDKQLTALFHTQPLLTAMQYQQ